MNKKILKKITGLIRRLFGVNKVLVGVNQVLEHLQKQSNSLHLQKQLLDRTLSYLEFVTIDYQRMKASEKYINLQKIIQLLSPMDLVDAKYRRIGRDHDGGYVMLDDFASRRIDAAYSFGISNDVSWDEDIAGLGIDVFMYDHTIDELPKQHPRFHFFKIGVTGGPSIEELKTLGTLIAENGHQHSDNLILKMDIEGSEWNVIEETSGNVLNQFLQIVIELHGLNPGETPENVTKIISALQKINQTHQAVHVHANGYCGISHLGDWTLPHLLEVTYVRRCDYADRFIKNMRTFPTTIDKPTFDWLPDVNLGRFALTDFKVAGEKTND